MLASGCLARSYDVPRDELMRVVRLPPEERSKSLRVVQRFSTSEDPPEAPPPNVTTGVMLGWRGPVNVGGHVHASTSGGSSGGGGGRGGGGGGAGADKAAAALLIVVGAGVGLALAATEGVRYDGWVEVHPLHPVHLRRGDNWAWVPLAALDANLVDMSDEVVIAHDEGPWRELARAPLDRVGFTYAFELGSGGLDAADGSSPWGFLGRLSLGGFPIQQIGVVASLGLGWAVPASGTIFNARYALELHVYPVQVGPLSAGFYGQAGASYAEQDLGTTLTIDRHVPLVGGGVLGQLEIATRLALTVRGGVAVLLADSDRPVLPEISVGFSIY